MFYEQMLKEQQYVTARIAKIEEQLRDMPKGKLLCAKNGNKFKWYVREGEKLTYLPRKDREFAVKLAQKKYYIARLEELAQKKMTLGNCIEAYKNNIDVLFEKNPGMKELLGIPEKNNDEEGEKWANAQYDTNRAFPEHLIHRASWGEVFRSKSEAMIAKCLRERGIAYRYECALTLGNETFYPDFTILHPKTGNIYYYEHYGRMDDPKYIRDNMPKLTTYANHGIVPGIHLILSFETQAEPLSMYTIESLLSQYFD